MVVPGGGAVSYERGTTVQQAIPRKHPAMVLGGRVRALLFWMNRGCPPPPHRRRPRGGDAQRQSALSLEGFRSTATRSAPSSSYLLLSSLELGDATVCAL